MADDKGSRKVVIIGAGPAGLTAAYELCRAGVESVVVEKDSVVGGIARTVNYKGYLFDIGGHRFFTKVKPVEDLWHEVMGEDFLKRGRLSRIYYNKKFFFYPLRFSNALSGLGLWNSFLIVLSYLKSRVFPQRREDNLEQWVSNRFGTRLYETFFKTYTEKVWGIPCSEIRAEWAAQRIKGLSLSTALRNALIKQKGLGGEVIKTLIDSFYYPRLGPGMMWERIADAVGRSGRSSVRMDTEVEGIVCAGGRVKCIEVKNGAGGEEKIEGNDFISTMPIRELIEKLKPAAPQEVLEAARSLNYRDFLTVTLIINKPDLFPDNWIYIHDPDVKVGRIQNFKNWSPQMVPDAGKTCLGLEYFCFEGDGLWTMKDEELIELGKRELGVSGLADPSDVEDGTVVRMPKAYPVYDSTYQEALGVIRGFLSSIDNLQLTGRNGMHKYNNQDHSMLTAMLAVRNILGERHDLWEVNADQEYHEEVREGKGEKRKGAGESAGALLSSTQPRVPVRSQLSSASDRALMQSFGKMDKLALAAAVGGVFGLSVFIGTLWLMLRESHANFGLLGQYFIGYTVTLEGAFIGMGYSFLWGFMFGWLFAYLRNLFIGYFIYKVRKKAKHVPFSDLLDYI